MTSIRHRGQPSEQKQFNMEAYVEWLLTPRGEREPATKTAFAEYLGVTPQTLRNYAKDPFVQAEVGKRGRALHKVENVQAVVENLFTIATGKVDASPQAQVSAAKAFLEWTDQVVEQVTDVDLSDLSFDDMRLILDNLEREALA